MPKSTVRFEGVWKDVNEIPEDPEQTAEFIDDWRYLPEPFQEVIKVKNRRKEFLRRFFLS